MGHPSELAAWPVSSLPSMLEQHAGLVALFDETDRLRWANGVFRRVFGLAADSHPSWSELMRHCHTHRQGVIIQCEDFEHWLAAAALRRGKQPFRQFEADTHDGSWFLVTQTTDARGWVLEIGVDVTDMGCSHRDLRVARDRAVRAAQEDPLTGVPNRAAVLERLRVELSRPGGAPWLALLDLDHFKQINDRLGHAAGDQVLRDFAGHLRAGLRRADACGRIGGEEFLVVLDGVDQTVAERVLNRLLAATRAAAPLAARPEFRYTCSAGLVQARAGERLEDLVARADAAMYEAKHAGRDRLFTAAAATPAGVGAAAPSPSGTPPAH